MKDIVLIRHGSTDWNKNNKVQGRNNIELNQDGINQINSIIPFIKIFNPDSLFCSPIKRAMQSAEIISTAINVKIIEMDEFMEINVGEWQGKSGADLLSLRSWNIYLNDPEKAHPEDGESFINFHNRVVNGFEAILKIKKNKVLIVTHSDVIRVIICYALNLPLVRIHSFKINLGSVSRINYDKNKIQIANLNYPLALMKGKL